MTEYSNPLALEFLKAQPSAAAKILEQIDTVSLSNFIVNIPVDYRVPILEKMLPYYAAKLCKTMQADVVSNLLAPLNISCIVEILQHFEKRPRKLIIDKFPVKVKAACTLLLRFSRDTVGAWMTPCVATAPLDASIDQVMNVVIQDDSLINTDCLLVIDRQQRFQGRVYYSDIMGARSNQLISSLLRADSDTISGFMSIDKAIEHKAWSHYDAIPVINRDKHLIGVLKYVDLRKAVARLKAQMPEQKSGQDSLMGISEIYGYTLISLFQTMSDAFQADIGQSLK